MSVDNGPTEASRNKDKRASARNVGTQQEEDKVSKHSSFSRRVKAGEDKRKGDERSRGNMFLSSY